MSENKANCPHCSKPVYIDKALEEESLSKQIIDTFLNKGWHVKENGDYTEAYKPIYRAKYGSDKAEVVKDLIKVKVYSSNEEVKVDIFIPNELRVEISPSSYKDFLNKIENICENKLQKLDTARESWCETYYKASKFLDLLKIGKCNIQIFFNIVKDNEK